MTTTNRNRPATTLAALALAITALLGSAACSVGTPGSESASMSDGGGAESAAQRSLASVASDSLADGGGPAATATTAEIAADRAIIRTGRLDLRSKDVPGVRARLVTEIAGLGGEVASEESRGDRRGRLERVLIVAEVPTERFADAMDAFAGLARTTNRSADALDVTEEVVDVAARVRTQDAAVRRMEQLLGRADSVGDVIRVEGELVRRQADLEALQARQESLAQKTSTATITVDLQRVRELREVDEPGAVAAGLATGWDAFGDATRALVFLLATLLPFLLALVILGAPVVWWRRRRAPRASGA